MENSIKLFEDKKVRVGWNEDEGKWYFSVIDVVGALSESSEPRRYWSDLKIKLKAEGSELYEKIVQLKMVADDGKMVLNLVLLTLVMWYGKKFSNNILERMWYELYI